MCSVQRFCEGRQKRDGVVNRGSTLARAWVWSSTSWVQSCRSYQLSYLMVVENVLRADQTLPSYQYRAAVEPRSYRQSWTDRDRGLRPRSNGFVTIMTDRGGLLWSGTSARNDRHSVTWALVKGASKFKMHVKHYIEMYAYMLYDWVNTSTSAHIWRNFTDDSFKFSFLAGSFTLRFQFHLNLSRSRQLTISHHLFWSWLGPKRRELLTHWGRVTQMRHWFR